MKNWKSLLCFVLLIVAVQAAGAMLTQPEIPGWYASLAKPAWNPPNWVFGPVWTVLYALIALAGWRVWVRLPENLSTRINLPPMRWYAAQLIANAAWSPLFFGMHALKLALADILLMIVFIILTMRHFRAFDRLAAWMLLPYLLWVCYATSLNAAIVWLNP